MHSANWIRPSPVSVPVLLALVAAAVAPGSAGAAEPVGLAFVVDALEANYSQAVPLELLLTDKDGAPIDGTQACRVQNTQPCRVSVTLVQDDGESEPDIIRVADDVAVDAEGRVRVRLTLVDGRHGGASFAADVDGLPYTIEARFRGAGAPLPLADDADCQSDQGTPDGRLCPASATASLLVFTEIPALAFGADVQAALGDTIEMAVTLRDLNGDAEQAGDAIDGPGPKLLADMTVRFFYDADNNGRPSLDELLGESQTNDFGVAAFSFFLDPTLVTAGDYAAGLHAEFAGDGRYGVARTSTRLQIAAGRLDVSRTVIEVVPGTLPANGVAEAEITVRLVDENNNLIGPDADDEDVVISADIGVLRDEVRRDVLDGTYKQTIRAQRTGGTARIAVTVNGEDAGFATLVFDGEPGCQCTARGRGTGTGTGTGTAPAGWGLGALLAATALLRRRRRT
jgi:hypothetical protein